MIKVRRSSRIQNRVDKINANKRKIDSQPCGSKSEPASKKSKVDKGAPSGDAEISGGVQFLASVPPTHKFQDSSNETHNKSFLSRIRHEMKILQEALPPGIWVKMYDDRLDLLSALIRGPEGTPYEGSLFLFDVKLPKNYPLSPPSFHYHSYTGSRINPNLYTSGFVCVSLLNTWDGNASERWSSTSTILQVLVSIQALILVKEPWYNEPGRIIENAKESRLYNEKVVIGSLNTLIKLSEKTHPIFEDEIERHIKGFGEKYVNRLKEWSSNKVKSAGKNDCPDFPLIPGSQDFCKRVNALLPKLRKIVRDAL